jgi:hypothetical protein
MFKENVLLSKGCNKEWDNWDNWDLLCMTFTVYCLLFIYFTQLPTTYCRFSTSSPFTHSLINPITHSLLTA